MVVQEVDLVDIEQTTVRLGEQPRLESRFTVTEGLAEVEGADDAILGSMEYAIELNRLIELQMEGSVG